MVGRARKGAQKGPGPTLSHDHIVGRPELSLDVGVVGEPVKPVQSVGA